MKSMAALLCLVGAVLADGVTAVPDDQAKEAVKQAREAFRSAESVEGKQGVVFGLHDVPNDYVIKELAKYLRNRDPAIQGVAALALGGQGHNKEDAGKLLLKTYEKEKKELEVAISCLDAMKALGWYGYWPALEKDTGKGTRSAIVIRIL